MPPSLPRLNSTYGVLENAVFTRNGLLKTRIFANRPDLVRRKFGGGASFPTITSAVKRSIRLVAGRRIPAQIVETVIPKISIFVTALIPDRAGADKSPEHKTMNSTEFLFVVLPKIDHQATPRFRNTGLFQSSSNGSDVTQIGDLVKAFKINNREPFFFHANSFYARSGDYGIIA